MKLATKIVLGFAIPMIMLTVIGITTYIVLNDVKHNARLTNEESSESLALAGAAYQMRLDAVQIHQWLTDISATRGQDGFDHGFDEAEKSMKSFFAGLAKFRKMYIKKNNKVYINKVKEIERAVNSYYENGKKMANAYISGGPAEGNKHMDSFDQAAKGLSDKLDPFIDQQINISETSMSSIVSSIENLNIFILIATLIALAFGITVSFLITRSITRPIISIVEGLRNGAEQTSLASNEVSSASQSLAQGASEQASSIEETSASLEEMASMSNQNADNAKQASALANQARTSAGTGSEAMTKLVNGMGRINKSSQEVSKVAKAIEEIAFQTNLLALNAAVEAARAGEAGAGFAVVAEEVRNLAQRASEQAKTTSKLIAESTELASQGTKQADEANRALEDIITGIQKVSELVEEITTASDEQAKGVEQVNTAVAEMDKVVQQNAANAQETSSSSEELSAQAKSMNAMVRELNALVAGSSGNVVRIVSGHQLHDPETKGMGSKVNSILYRDETETQNNALTAKTAHLSVKVGNNRKKTTPEEVIPFGDEQEFRDF